MSPISKPQLLLYLQLSQIESVYQVAQNPDIMALILRELEPMWNYNSVVKEFHGWTQNSRLLHARARADGTRARDAARPRRVRTRR